MFKEKEAFIQALFTLLKVNGIDSFNENELKEIATEKLRGYELLNGAEISHLISKSTELFSEEDKKIIRYKDALCIEFSNKVVNENVDKINARHFRPAMAIVKCYKKKEEQFISTHELAPLLLAAFVNKNYNDTEACYLPTNLKDGVALLASLPEEQKEKFAYLVDFKDIENFKKNLFREIQRYLNGNDKIAVYDFLNDVIKINLTAKEANEIFSEYTLNNIRIVYDLARTIHTLPIANHYESSRGKQMADNLIRFRSAHRDY